MDTKAAAIAEAGIDHVERDGAAVDDGRAVGADEDARTRWRRVVVDAADRRPW